LNWGSLNGPVTRPVTAAGHYPPAAPETTSRPVRRPTSRHPEVEPGRRAGERTARRATRRCAPARADVNWTPMASPSSVAGPRHDRRAPGWSSLSSDRTACHDKRALRGAWARCPPDRSVMSRTPEVAKPAESMNSMSACRNTRAPTVNAGTLNGLGLVGKPCRRGGSTSDNECHAISVERSSSTTPANTRCDSTASGMPHTKEGSPVEPRRLIWSRSTATVRRKRFSRARRRK